MIDLIEPSHLFHLFEQHKLIFMVATTSFLCFCTLHIYLFHIFIRRQRLSKIIQEHGCKPARSIPRPLLGIPAALKFIQAFNEHRFLASLQWLFKRKGHTFTVNMPLGRPAIWTDEPTNIKSCLSDQFDHFEIGKDRHQVMFPILGKGVFTSDGREWSHIRATIRPSFSRSQVADLDMFEHHIHNLLARIPKDGSSVEMQELFFQLTMDTTTDFLFGCSTASLLPNADPENRDFSNAFTHALGRTLHRGNWGFLMDWIPDRQFYKSCNTLKQFTENLVRQALASQNLSSEKSSKRYIWLHEVAKTNPNPTELRDHALNILVAGRDTTAALLSFTFFLLSRHKDVWSKLCTEIDSLDGEKPSFTQLKRLKFLHCIINEALRLYPPVPWNMRVCKTNTFLPAGGGSDSSHPILVRKGEAILYSVWSMHRRKDIWGEDANEFNPARWESGQRGWEFLPFNGGPRICIGQGFALAEAAYVIVRLVQEFEDIESADERVWKEQIGLTLSSLNGVSVKLHPRKTLI